MALSWLALRFSPTGSRIEFRNLGEGGAYSGMGASQATFFDWSPFGQSIPNAIARHTFLIHLLFHFSSFSILEYHGGILKF